MQSQSFDAPCPLYAPKPIRAYTPVPWILYEFSLDTQLPQIDSSNAQPRYQSLPPAGAPESKRPSNEQPLFNTKLLAEQRGNQVLAAKLAATELAAKTAAEAATFSLGTTVDSEFSVPPLNRWGKLVQAGKRVASRVRKGSK